MKKNETIQNYKKLFLGFILGISIIFVFAKWQTPETVKENSAVPPINVSSNPQGKNTNPTLGSLLDIGGSLSTQGLAVFGDALINGVVTISSFVRNTADRFLCVDTVVPGKFSLCNIGITPSYALKVVKNGSGSADGLVVSDVSTGTVGGTRTGGEGDSGLSPTINCGGTCLASITGGTVVTLTATPGSGDVFAGWSGACTNTTGSCVVTMSSTKNVTATFLKPIPQLTISRQYGQGITPSDQFVKVVSSPVGINCGTSADCTHLFTINDNVTLSVPGNLSHTIPAPMDGSYTGLLGWGGDVPENCWSSFTASCTIKMLGARNVSAIFGIAKSLYVSVVNGDGGSEIRGAVVVDVSRGLGSVYPFSNSDISSCVRWGTINGGTAPQDWVIAGRVNDCLEPIGTPEKNHGVWFRLNEMVTLKAVPMTGYVFTGWSGGYCSGKNLTCILTMSQAKEVTATFALPSAGLTVFKNGSGGGVVSSSPSGIDCGNTCNKNYAIGTSVTLTAVPDENSFFAGWDGACTNTTGVCTVTISDATSVIAKFVHPELVVTKALGGMYSSSQNGYVTSSVGGINCGVNCGASYAKGTSVTLTANLGDGSTFAGWSGACSGMNLTCTLTMSQSKEVIAHFNGMNMYYLDVNIEGDTNASIHIDPLSIDCDVSHLWQCSNFYWSNQALTLTATPGSSGSVFLGWSGACTNTTGPCTVTMSQTRSVIARFLKR